MFAHKRCFAGKVLVLAAATAVAGVACDEQRQKECSAFTAAMEPIEAPDGNDKVVPSLETVAAVKKHVEALKPRDQPLQIYAENSVKTLAILSSTLEVRASSSPPDGTDDVIRRSLREARAEARDVKRYCAE